MQYDNISFCIHPPFEFYYALEWVVLKEKYLKILKDENIKLQEDFIEKIEDFEKNLTTYSKWEINYFFEEDVKPADGIGQMMLWGYILNNTEITNVKQLLDFIEEDDIANLFSNLVRYIYYENTFKNIEEEMEFKTLKMDLKAMTELIKGIDFKNKERKKKILECMENPEETKLRYMLLLRQFYEKSYKQHEQEVLNRSLVSIQKYEKAFAKNPTRFFRDYFNDDINNIKGKLKIHLSYLLSCVGGEFWALCKDEEWMTFGSEIIEYQNEEHKKEDILNFLKAVSDKKRMDIITLLSDQDFYVNEIAEKLEMSAATASYHLSMLQTFDIVNYERSDHRFYYHLNKKKLKENFDKAADFLTND